MRNTLSPLFGAFAWLLGVVWLVVTITEWTSTGEFPVATAAMTTAWLAWGEVNTSAQPRSRS